MLHVILGAGGAIGTPLADELLSQGASVRTVSRTGRGPEQAERRQADLNDAGQVLGVVEEGATVYLLAGLSYRSRTWEEQWPRIMRSAVAACAAKAARLIFFDNVYLYGRVDGPMTEETPVRPSSRKGEVRAGIASFLQNEMAAGRVSACIARSADFYGPYAEKTSVPSLLVFDRLAALKPARVIVDADAKHSYTYTLDCAKALCVLANSSDAFGQVWHMPTAAPPPSGREFVEMAAAPLGVPPWMSIIPAWVFRASGLVSPMMRELTEMLYQNDHDYIFDSSKFERRFGFRPTPYEEGIRATIKHRANGASRKTPSGVAKSATE